MEESKIDLRRMIRLDQVEDLLSSMMEKIDQQEAAIHGLQQLCLSFAKQQSVDERNFDLYASVKKLSQEIKALQVAATARLGDDKT